MSAVVWQDSARIEAGKASTHAVVVGVGDYPFLIGGSEDPTPINGGLRQLSSPPVSAHVFASWLLDDDGFHNPDAPLASVSLLTSDASARAFTHAKLDAPVMPMRADARNLVDALRAWKRLGDADEDSIMLFFFCGHGVARGLDGLTLLAADYGAVPDMPMEGAVDFAAFQRGMAQCKASRQVFFVDACRQVSDIARNTTATGEAVIQDNINRPHASPWNYAVLFATVEGEGAYGRRNRPSFYTEALIKGLDGGAANNRNARGEWRVGTSELNQSIHRGLSRRGPKIKNPAVRLVDFEFHWCSGEPVVPVTVFCENETDTAAADLTCERNGDVIASRGPASEAWETGLAPDKYDFRASIDARSGARPGVFVLPPYGEVEIKVPS